MCVCVCELKTESSYTTVLCPCPDPTAGDAGDGCREKGLHRSPAGKDFSNSVCLCVCACTYKCLHLSVH